MITQTVPEGCTHQELSIDTLAALVVLHQKVPTRNKMILPTNSILVILTFGFFPVTPAWITDEDWIKIQKFINYKHTSLCNMYL